MFLDCRDQISLLPDFAKQNDAFETHSTQEKMSSISVNSQIDRNWLRLIFVSNKYSDRIKRIHGLILHGFKWNYFRMQKTLFGSILSRFKMISFRNRTKEHLDRF